MVAFDKVLSMGQIELFDIKTEQKKEGGSPRDVMVKVMGCGIVVSEFELLSRYYVHFRTNILAKSMNLLILQAIG